MKGKLILIVAIVLFINELSAQNLGKSLLFSGEQDYVEIPDNDYLDISNSYTIEAYIQTHTDTMLVLAKEWCAPGGFSYYFQVINGHLRWGFDDDGDCYAISLYDSDSAIIDKNECAHIAVVHTDTYVKLYKNGILVPGSLVGGSYSLIKNSSEPLLIGAYRFYEGYYGIFCSGTIDELRYWNYERTQSEIMEGKDTPLIGNETGLVAYYDMEDTGVGNNIIFTNKATISGSQIDGVVHGSEATPSFVNACEPIGIYSYMTENNIKIYPNPTTGIIYIQSKDIRTVEVYNVIGELLKTFKEVKEVDLRNQPIGIYFIKIIDGNGTYIKKITKQ